jgi:hypothetical protein
MSLAPGLEFEFRLSLELGTAIDQGVRDNARHRRVPIVGGVVEGARIHGVIQTGGADQQFVDLTDGVTYITATHPLVHTDGTRILLLNRAVRHGPPEVLAALARGEDVDPTLYYFRGTAHCTVDRGPHRWLMHSALVSVGRRGPSGIELEVYRVT